MVSKENYNVSRFPIHNEEAEFGWDIYFDLKSGQFVISRLITGAAIRMFSLSAKFGCTLKGNYALDKIYNFIEEDGSWYLKEVCTNSTIPKEDLDNILILTPFQARMIKHLLKRKY